MEIKMKLTRQKLEEMISDVLGEEEEMMSQEPTGPVETEADAILTQLEELAASVGHVSLEKESPAVWSQLQNYITDLSHRLRGSMEEAQLKE